MLSESRTFWVCWAFILRWTWQASASLPPSNDTGCPSVCFCDDVGAYVSCVGDGLWQLPRDIPKTAERLELRNFVLSDLDGLCLETLTKLQELKLQQSRLSTIEAGALSHLSQLTRLDLAQNALVNLTSGAFEGLKNLRYLDLSSNLLEDIEEAFEGLPNVEQLNLRANRLPRLSSRTLKGLQKVQYLNLDFNAVAHIDVDAFQHLTNLAHLILSNNPLRTLSRLDFFGARLQYVDVSNIGLERVPQSLTRFVRDLRLARNNISRIGASDFESYPYLGLLVLDDNDIGEIENDALGRQEYLQRLWLNGNKLVKVPMNLPASLVALYMEENLLEEIRPYNFRGLVNLEQLFLQRNRIKVLTPCAFCHLVSLKSLDLQANQIEHLVDGVFANLSRLEMLDLSQNNLRVLDSRCLSGLDGLKTLQMSRVSSPVIFEESVFDTLKHLQVLEMYDSSDFVHKMVTSTRVLHGLRRIQELNVMHNKLTDLRSDFASFFPQLKVIKLSGNSWHCGPNITWLAGWIKTSTIQFYRSYNIRCATPEHLQLKPIMLLNQEDLWTTTIPPIHTSTFRVPTSTSTAVPQRSSRDFSVSTLPFQYTTFSSKIDPKVASVIQSETTSSSLPTTIVSTLPTTQMHFAISTVPTTSQKVRHPVSTPETNRSASQVQRLYLTPSKRGRPSVQYQWSEVTAITVSSALAGSGLVVVTATAVLITVHRCRQRGHPPPSKRSGVRRSSSISYHPQRDEVSIVTVSEGTVGWKTATHTGLGNRLYYALENVDILGEGLGTGAETQSFCP